MNEVNLPVMNKQMMMIAAVIVALIAVAAGAFFVMSSKKSTSGSMTSIEGTPAESASKASIKSLLGAGKNVTCEISYPDNGGSGTVYVAGEKMRSDYMMTVSGKTMEGHMISDGAYMYSWQGTTGMKFKADAVATPTPAAGSQTQQQGADIDQEVDMDCGNWSVDNSKFTPPTDVTFTDATQMMMQTQQQTQTSGSGAPKIDSSYCDSIADPQAKAACMGAGY